MDNRLIDDDDFDPTPPRRTRLGVIMLVVVLHLIVIAGLVRAFTPDIAARVVASVLSTFDVTVITPPPASPPPPAPASDRDAGDQGSAGKKAVARAVKAPEPRLALSPAPAPRARSTGTANTAGALDQGGGTGAGSSGDATGAGGKGTGSGGGAVSRPSVRSGEINDARDFPVPPGGRHTRFGKSVIVQFTVTADGLARGCAVSSSSVDQETTARVCPLVIQRIRFHPARRADGTPVEARYGYIVRFTAR